MPRLRLAAALGLAALIQPHPVLAAKTPAGDAELPVSEGSPCSQDAAEQLNYASILFYKARRVLTTDRAAGEAIFREVEAALRRALELAAAQPDTLSRALLQSQCAYMLGDIALFVRRDADSAMESYRLALQHYPEHDGAEQAMQWLKSSKPAPK
jgi:hypothetical protein